MSYPGLLSFNQTHYTAKLKQHLFNVCSKVRSATSAENIVHISPESEFLQIIVYNANDRSPSHPGSICSSYLGLTRKLASVTSVSKVSEDYSGLRTTFISQLSELKLGRLSDDHVRLSVIDLKLESEFY